MTASNASNYFGGLKKPKSLLQYQLMAGVPDYGNMNQFDLYESGYQFIKVVKIPTFLTKLAAWNSDYTDLINNYAHIIEKDFRGLSGLDDITSENFTITNGITDVNVISKVSMQSASTVNMTFYERSGSPLTKLNELFLTGIKDPKTLVKTYHGLIQSGQIKDPGYDYEVFTLLYFVTDNTLMNIEKAFLLLVAQPNKAENSIYNGEKGTVEQKEITIDWNCYPVYGPAINAKAQDVLNWMTNEDNADRPTFQFDQMKYTGTDSIDPKATV